MAVLSAKRYPGSQPFQRDQQHIFFGRERDITNLYRTISINELTVLYGESGLGKSSLLNAGVIPQFTGQDVLAIFPRLYAFDKKSPSNPLQKVLSQLLTEAQEIQKNAGTPVQEAVFMSAVQPDPKQQSLWQQAKSILWLQREKRAGLILVFDQFEELFTYPKELVEEFGRAFGELLDNRMPEAFRQRFYEMLEKGDTEPGSQEELAFLEKSPPLKVVLGTRLDRLGLLKQITPFYPNILLNQNLFRLLPLTREQACEAITKPAAQSGAFATPPFTYAQATLDAMLDYLTEGNDQTVKDVETTQLQVICQHIENKLIAPDRPNQVVQREELGNIDLIFQNFYDDIVASLPENQQVNVQNMVENGLIFEPDQLRLSLYGEQIQKTYGVLSETLTELVSKHHLLRVEERSAGLVYEISHDSLVDPILASKKIREEEAERLQRQAAAEAERLQQEAALKAAREQEAARRAAEAAEAERQRQAAEEAAHQERLRRERRLYWRYAIVASSLFVIALVAASFAFYQSTRAQSAEQYAVEQRVLAEDNAQVAQQNAEIAQEQRDSAVVLKSKLEASQAQFLQEAYQRRFERAQDLMADKRFAEARIELEEAQNIDSPERNLTELRRLIGEAQTKAVKEKRFRELTKQADGLRDNEKYREAYELYGQAQQLNFDNESLEDRLVLCRRILLETLKEDLRSADIFLRKANRPKLARELMSNSINPILNTLGATADAQYRVQRDEIQRRLGQRQK